MGRAAGFDNTRKALLPIRNGTTCCIADLNRDGYLDIVAPNIYDPLPPAGTQYHPHALGGSTQVDTFVYWGGANGYSAARRQILRSVGILDCAIADLKNDGYLDIVLVQYSGSPNRDGPSSIFWNGPKGFSAQNVSFLPCFATSGVQVADFNNDGFQDVRLANHVKDGDHGAAQNYIYWGGASGFSDTRRAEIYAPGNHYLTGVDVGNVYDRSDRYDYISPPFDTGQASQFKRIEWEADAPFRTDLEFQIRTAATKADLLKAAWTGPTGQNSTYRHSGDELKDLGSKGRWIQYKATLVSPNDANTPVLRAVSISYQ